MSLVDELTWHCSEDEAENNDDECQVEDPFAVVDESRNLVQKRH